MITNIPIEHRWPIGAVVRHRHGQRHAVIESIEFTWALVYDLRYIDNDQRATRCVHEVDAVFEEVPS